MHYDEIGLKGKNRGSFERLLMDNISKKTGVTSLKRESGQITLTTKVSDTLRDALSKIPGIAYFSFAKKRFHFSGFFFHSKINSLFFSSI